MPTLWFCVPAHGRENLTRVCLRQLRRTCDDLTAAGIEASAVVVADDANLDTAAELGFATVERDNTYLARKFNDGIQLACDPAFNPRPADYVVPCGSDDWVDPRLFHRLPGPGMLLAFRRCSFVREDGAVITPHTVRYQAGVGIRVYPAEMMAAAEYRPADEDRTRACDTSILVNTTRYYVARHGREPAIWYGDLHDFQIVDWKTRGRNINSYADVRMHRDGADLDDPFARLAAVYPAEALEEMRACYAGQMVAA